MAKDKNKEAFDHQKLATEIDIAGHKMGIDAAKSQAQIGTQKEQIAAQLIATQLNASSKKGENNK